ncbi:MAG: ABC transporter permease [Chlorobi bacterium CHB2]|nr:ABC transporter permease [Chlorobi bacterium CHB2]
MGTYILKRILLFIPTFIAITFLTFGISRLVPGDPAERKAGMGREGQQIANRELSQERIQRLRKEWHLDEPIPVQYMIWAAGMVQLDFGKSFKDDKPVIDKIMSRLPLTVLMSVISAILAYIIAIPIGIYSASRNGSLGERSLSTSLFMLYSLPDFWIGTLFIVFLTVGSNYFEIFPNNGLTSTGAETWPFFKKLADSVWHLVLPIVVYTYASFAYISRQMRGAMMETLRQDYIRTARAKGLADKVVTYRHALRNSLIPIITLFAGLFPAFIGGSVVVERIFNLPGVGQLAFQAATELDYPVVMGILTMSALLTMTGVLVGDILYSVVDPRIAYAKKSS